MLQIWLSNVSSQSFKCIFSCLPQYSPLKPYKQTTQRLFQHQKKNLAVKEEIFLKRETQEFCKDPEG